ncbi:hypothetical protein C8F01DRAFT_1083241 [Mycena amicta]|nr:hypothetical protein C8F01DRAFT_1083241 [Mycena amicta]
MELLIVLFPSLPPQANPLISVRLNPESIKGKNGAGTGKLDRLKRRVVPSDEDVFFFCFSLSLDMGSPMIAFGSFRGTFDFTTRAIQVSASTAKFRRAAMRSQLQIVSRLFEGYYYLCHWQSLRYPDTVSRYIKKFGYKLGSPPGTNRKSPLSNQLTIEYAAAAPHLHGAEVSARSTTIWILLVQCKPGRGVLAGRANASKIVYICQWSNDNTKWSYYFLRFIHRLTLPYQSAQIPSRQKDRAALGTLDRLKRRVIANKKRSPFSSSSDPQS